MEIVNHCSKQQCCTILQGLYSTFTLFHCVVLSRTNSVDLLTSKLYIHTTNNTSIAFQHWSNHYWYKQRYMLIMVRMRVGAKHYLKESRYRYWVRLPNQSGLLEYEPNTSTGMQKTTTIITVCSLRNNFGAWVGLFFL